MDTLLFFLYDFLCSSCFLPICSLFYTCLRAGTVSKGMGVWGITGEEKLQRVKLYIRLFNLGFITATSLLKEMHLKL